MSQYDDAAERLGEPCDLCGEVNCECQTDDFPPCPSDSDDDEWNGWNDHTRPYAPEPTP